MGMALTGGSKSKSTSTAENQAYGLLKDQFSPMLGQANTGSNALSALLSGDLSGLNAYKKATGFDAMAEAGSRGITGNAAASGLLRSGSTGKALQAYGNQVQGQAANSYMDRLLQQANLGFQAGGLLAGAGNKSTQESSSKKKDGLGGLMGSAMSAFAMSDRRLKKNIFKVGELPSGLNLYQYRYLDDSGPFIGVMADEVEKIMPEALGPTIYGFKSVNYDRIEGVM